MLWFIGYIFGWAISLGIFFAIIKPAVVAWMIASDAKQDAKNGVVQAPAPPTPPTETELLRQELEELKKKVAEKE